MRKSIWFLAAALIAGSAACKQSERDNAAKEVRKTQEKVQDEAKDVQKEVEDLNKEAKDVAKEGKELSEAEQQMMQSRDRLKMSVKTRLSNIDRKLAILEQRTDPVSKKLAGDLKIKRDTVAQRANAADSIAVSSWDTYQTEIDDNLKMLEGDLDKALDTNEPGTDRVPTPPTEPTRPIEPTPPQ